MDRNKKKLYKDLCKKQTLLNIRDKTHKAKEKKVQMS